jgi:hypothetical protein
MARVDQEPGEEDALRQNRRGNTFLPVGNLGSAKRPGQGLENLAKGARILNFKQTEVRIGFPHEERAPHFGKRSGSSPGSLALNYFRLLISETRH